MIHPDMEEAFCGAVTVGERGQVVIPAQARDKMGSSAGDRLLAFSLPHGDGVVFIKLQALQRAADALAPFLERELPAPATEEPAVAGLGGESA